jgi:hypothetical protein
LVLASLHLSKEMFPCATFSSNDLRIVTSSIPWWHVPVLNYCVH